MFNRFAGHIHHTTVSPYLHKTHPSLHEQLAVKKLFAVRSDHEITDDQRAYHDGIYMSFMKIQYKKVYSCTHNAYS